MTTPPVRVKPLSETTDPNRWVLAGIFLTSLIGMIGACFAVMVTWPKFDVLAVTGLLTLGAGATLVLYIALDLGDLVAIKRAELKQQEYSKTMSFQEEA